MLRRSTSERKIEEISRCAGLPVDEIKAKLHDGSWVICQCGYPTATVDLIDCAGDEMCEGCAEVRT